jgi:glutamyl-tRNA reductase
MDHIGVVGLSWRQGGPESIARFSRPPEERVAVLRALAAALKVEEAVYLSTCNRVEVAFAVREGQDVGDRRRIVFEVLTGAAPQDGEAERSLRAWTGEGAVEHLLLVAAGLDSAQLGETEIAGQVREALSDARSEGLAGRRLGGLFDSALKISRRVRGGTALGEGRTSLAEIALDPVRVAYENSGAPIALLGVSPMTERCALSLTELGAPLLIVNRTLARAETLCAKLGAGSRARSLDDFRAAPEAVSALIAATGSPHKVLDRTDLTKLAKTCSGGPLPLLVDFAVPPDLDPQDAAALDLQRIGMEEITARAAANRTHKASEAAQARELIDQALDRLRGQLGRARLNAAVAALQTNYQSAAQESLERLLRQELRNVGESEREALRRWTETLARRFAHLPSRGLRELAEHEGSDVVRAFFSGAADEFIAEMDRALEQDTVHARGEDQEDQA